MGPADYGSARPCPFDRSRVQVGIVHIGLGAFARAHLAVYTHEVLAKGDLDWGICGISMRSASVRNALAPQGGLYTLLEHGSQPRIIGSVVRCLVEPEAPRLARQALLDPAVRVVTSTVTESGYEADGPVVRLLVDSLAARRAAGVSPFTVLCLDNIQGTGATVRSRVLERAREESASLATWIEEHVPFPRSMVDRMVPRTTARHRGQAREALGVVDAWPVACERFRQWVIEDDFPSGRPDWESAGASFVRDAAPWEELKLRMFNAGHLALACLAMLTGRDHIAAAASDPILRSWVERLLRHEVAPTLRTPDGLDLERYLASMLERLENAELGYLATQTASNGSLKLRARLLPSVLDLRGRGADRLALIFAAWIHIVTGADSTRISDPNMERIRAARSAGPRDARSVARRVLAIPGLFDEIQSLEGFAERVCDLAALVAAQGIIPALQLADTPQLRT